MRELREDTFSRNKNKDAHDHVDRVLNIGPIPRITPTQALIEIQTIADHPQKWHDGTSSINVSSSSNTDGLTAIVSKLDKLGCDMKKLKENIYAIQVGCQICEGPHLNKECPLNEEVKQLEDVKYGEFKRSAPFNEKALDLDKDPIERSFDNYKWVFDLEIEQLADKYELGLGKKGHILDMIWENRKNIQGKAKEWWYDYWLEEDEKQENGDKKYDPPMVHMETFEITIYLFDNRNSLICVTDEIKYTLSLGRENGS
nr:RNA-directed DNA polymerase, eukaryota, reverse transcriptase zinc-binding domain protein [Tanacetum cinerariifolium]